MSTRVEQARENILNAARSDDPIGNLMPSAEANSFRLSLREALAARRQERFPGRVQTPGTSGSPAAPTADPGQTDIQPGIADGAPTIGGQPAFGLGTDDNRRPGLVTPGPGMFGRSNQMIPSGYGSGFGMGDGGGLGSLWGRFSDWIKSFGDDDDGDDESEDLPPTIIA